MPTSWHRPWQRRGKNDWQVPIQYTCSVKFMALKIDDFQMKKNRYFSSICSKRRLCELLRTASIRHFNIYDQDRFYAQCLTLN